MLFASPSLAFVLTFILTGEPVTTAVARPAPPSGLTFPREEHGACPLGCCPSGRWTATVPLTARRERSAEAPVAFRVARGQAVEALGGVVVTTRPGRAKAVTAADLGGVRLARGEEVPVLREAREGAYIVWVGGRALEAAAEESGGTLRVLSPPHTVWWVQLRNARGDVGWSQSLQTSCMRAKL